MSSLDTEYLFDRRSKLVQMLHDCYGRPICQAGDTGLGKLREITASLLREVARLRGRIGVLIAYQWPNTGDICFETVSHETLDKAIAHINDCKEGSLARRR